MNRELLARLAIDRAVGEMSLDMKQLFSEYLRTDSHAAGVVRSMEETLSLAKHVTKGGRPSFLPTFPVSTLQRTEIWWRRARRLAGVGAMAACLAIGLGFGRWFVPTANKPGDTSPAVLVKAVQEHGQTEGSESGLWSIQRIRERSLREVPGRSRPLMWHSPVAAPRLGDPS
jgi:hypothetical protein